MSKPPLTIDVRVAPRRVARTIAMLYGRHMPIIPGTTVVAAAHQSIITPEKSHGRKR